MRLLLDENLDRRLKRFFGDGHEVVTVQERSWGGKENGELLEDAQLYPAKAAACSTPLSPMSA